MQYITDSKVECWRGDPSFDHFTSCLGENYFKPNQALQNAIIIRNAVRRLITKKKTLIQ